VKNISWFGSADAVALAISLLLGSACLRVANAAQEPNSPDAPAGNAENGKRLFAETVTNVMAAKDRVRR
jgi:hypothetical protein